MRIKYLLLAGGITLAVGCGTVHTNERRAQPPGPWITVGQISTTVGDAGPQRLNLAADVAFVAGATNVATEDTTGLLTPTTESDTLDFGEYGFDTIRINKLSVCGTSGTDKCTAARIVVYVSSTNEGFYNSTDGYSVPMMINGTTQIGHLEAGATELASYTIPASDRKLTNSDFGTVVWPLSAEFSNAGAGSYAATITMAVQVQ